MNKTIQVINHDTREVFELESLEDLIEWLNDNDPIYSFKLEEVK